MSRRLESFQGSELIADTDARTGKAYYGFVVQEDTVVATLAGGNGSSTATNYLTTIGLSGKTLKQGALITVPYEETIKNLTLTSGSVIAYSA
jgi:hypothetical protein